jgi:transposase
MKYIMDKQTLGKLALIKGAVENRYTVNEVALRLNLSNRRIKQLKKAFREYGEPALIHGNCGKHPSNYTDEKLRDKIIALKKTEVFKNANFTHFKELLLEHESIEISYTSLSRILKNAGIVSKRSHRSESRCFRRRKRKSAFGEMLQADGSSYDWFGTGQRFTAHGFVDDATGSLTGLYFCQNECLMGYLEVLRQTLINHGLPGEFYLDKASIFFVSNKKEEHWTIEEQLAGRPLGQTQFGMIVQEQLEIKMTRAHTPQAKGRIERLWGTLQDRLPIWLKLNGIMDMERANGNIDKIIQYYNAHFAVIPETPETAFVRLHESFDLDKLLVVRYERKTDNCGCFSYNNVIFQIDSKKPLVKKKVLFIFGERIGFMAKYGQEYFPVSCLGVKHKGKTTHIPEVTKLLLEREYYSDIKKQAA